MNHNKNKNNICFSYIIEKYLKISYEPFINFNNINNENSIQKNIFKNFILDKNKPSKLFFFVETLKNKYIVNNEKIKFINNFNKIQHIYYILNKLAFVYKYKKSKLIVDYDMCLNTLDKNHYLTFCLYQNNNRYLFNINDIVKIITTSLMNSPMFFSEPLVSKNPFNNVPLNKSALYNIYFMLQRKNIKIHELFYKFFLQNFDLSNFKKYNEYLIREYAIDNYIKNSPNDSLYNMILSMLIEYNKLVAKKNRFRFITLKYL
jgi:hypothetical protein